MKYKSELIKDIVEARGHEKSSLHYESECIEKWIEETKGSYPKLCDYQSEWLNYINENPLGNFPYEIITDVTEATVNNVVPYAYGSAILKGNTKYRDINTGDILDTFDETKNLELVTVRMPVLTTTNRINVFIENKEISKGFYNGGSGIRANHDYMDGYICDVEPNTTYSLYFKDGEPDANKIGHVSFWNENTFISGWETKPITFTTPTNCNKLRFAYDRRVTNINPLFIPSNIVLSIGTGVVYDESFKTNILTVNEPIELRGIGDVKDELDCLTGEVTERVGEVTFNGALNERWLQFDNTAIQEKTCLFAYYEGIPSSPSENLNMICDKFIISKNGYSSLLNTDEEMVHVYADGAVYFRILKSKLSTQNHTGFKEWLSQNPFTIQYQLKTESIKTVDLNIQDQDGNTLSKIRPIEGTMQLMTEGDTIKPLFSGEIPVEATTQNLASFIKEE